MEAAERVRAQETIRALQDRVRQEARRIASDRAFVLADG